MKARGAFLLSLAFALVGLSLRLGALGQFQDGVRIRAQSRLRDYPADQWRRGAALLYASLPFAIASAVYAFISYRRREPAWRWATVALLGFYLVVSLAPP